MTAINLNKSLARSNAEKWFLGTAAVGIVGATALLVTFGSHDVAAKQAYSQSTGYACAKCHTGAPSKSTVNAFGKAWLSKQK
jgi:hypothetical protein